jgi:hypothetical protein
MGISSCEAIRIDQCLPGNALPLQRDVLDRDLADQQLLQRRFEQRLQRRLALFLGPDPRLTTERISPISHRSASGGQETQRRSVSAFRQVPSGQSSFHVPHSWYDT